MWTSFWIDKVKILNLFSEGRYGPTSPVKQRPTRIGRVQHYMHRLGFTQQIEVA